MKKSRSHSETISIINKLKKVAKLKDKNLNTEFIEEIKNKILREENIEKVKDNDNDNKIMDKGFSKDLEIIDVSGEKPLKIPKAKVNVNITFEDYINYTNIKDNEKSPNSKKNSELFRKQNQLDIKDYSYKKVLKQMDENTTYYNCEPLNKGFIEFKKKFISIIDEEMKKNGNDLNSFLFKYRSSGLGDNGSMETNIVLKEISRSLKAVVKKYYLNELDNIIKETLNNSIFLQPLGIINRDIYKKEEEVTGYLKESLPIINDEIREYFLITKDNLRITWWDKTGSLRLKYNFPEFFIRAMNLIKERKNWDNNIFKEVEVLFFNEAVSCIYEAICNDDSFYIDSSKRDFRNFFNNKAYIYSINRVSSILNGLFKVFENPIKTSMKYYNFQEVENLPYEVEINLSKSISKEILIKYGDFMGDFLNNKLEDFYMGLIEVMPKKWMEICHTYWASTDINHAKYKNNNLNQEKDLQKVKEIIFNKKISIISKILNLEVKGKIIRELSKGEKDEDILLILLYLDAVFGKLTKAKEKRLLELIHITNKDKVLKDINKEIIPKDLREILLNKEQIRRKVILDKNKVKSSMESLNKTIDKVNEYIGSGEDDEVNETTRNIETSPNNIKISDSKIHKTSEKLIKNKESKKVEKNIENKNEVNKNNTSNMDETIKSMVINILDKGFISLDEVNIFSKKVNLLTNVFINEANKKLYEYVEDEVLIIENENLYIDEFYVDDIKEIFK